MNLKLLYLSILCSVMLVGCGGSGDSSANTDSQGSSQIKDNTKDIFNIPSIPNSESLPTNNLN